MSRTAEQLRVHFGAPDFASITFWKATPAASADLAVASRIASEESERPTYVASYGSLEEAISLNELNALIAAGATPRKV